MPKMLTTREAAQRLGVTPSRILALIKGTDTSRAKLPAKKFGHVWMIDPADLAKVRKRPNGRPRKR